MPWDWWDTALPCCPLSVSLLLCNGTLLYPFPHLFLPVVMPWDSALPFSPPLFLPVVMPLDTVLPSPHLSFCQWWCHWTLLCPPSHLSFCQWWCLWTLYCPLPTSLSASGDAFGHCIALLPTSLSASGDVFGHCIALSPHLFLSVVMPWDSALPSPHLSFCQWWCHGTLLCPSPHLSFCQWWCHGPLSCPLATCLSPGGDAVGLCTVLSLFLFLSLIVWVDTTDCDRKDSVC